MDYRNSLRVLGIQFLNRKFDHQGTFTLTKIDIMRTFTLTKIDIMSKFKTKCLVITDFDESKKQKYCEQGTANKPELRQSLILKN